MSDHLITVSIARGVARVVLNRRERRNALSLKLLEELQIVLSRLAGDAEASVVVIAGAGVAFSAGHDLGEMVERNPGFYEDLFTKCTDVMLAIQDLPQPVIAEVDGAAIAAGCQLVAACDLAIASVDSTFATPGVKIGLFCSTPMVPVSRAVGRKRAMEMLLTGEPIDAVTACDWGLINAAVAREELTASVSDLTDRILRYSPTVIGMGKAAFYRQVAAADAEAYDIVQPVMRANAEHPDAQEGIRAFLEKRSPDWPSQRTRQ